MKQNRLMIVTGAVLTVALLLAVFVGTLFPRSLMTVAGAYLAMTPLRVAVMVIAAALIVLIVLKTKSALTPKKRESGETVSLGETDGGVVQVSMAALEAMTRRSVGELNGVKETEVSLASGENGFDVTLTLKVSESVKLPELTDGMRQNVKDALEGFTGKTVGNVTVVVADIETSGADKSAEA